MSFVIPEDFLENIRCSECFKYLSAIPIKIYQNRQIKCGRCTKTDDGGTYSLLEKIAKLALFKCINRFDGCRTYLTYNQVENHEKQCLSKEQFCPICIEPTQIPTYNMLQHFKLCHKGSILQNPYLRLDIGLKFSKILLYMVKDYMFFIYINCDSVPDNVSFKIVLLRELTKNTILLFSILSGNSDVKTNINCGRENGQDFVYRKSTFENNLLFVSFELKEETVVGKIIEANNNNTENKNLSVQRQVYNGNLQKLYPGMSISNMVLRIVPFCYICSELFIGLTTDYNRCGWCILNEKFQFVCLSCLEYFKTVIKKSLVAHIPISFEVYTDIFYFCTWKCHSILLNRELLIHEMTCSLQPSQECPVANCEFKGNLSLIDYHFRIVHENNETSLTFNSSTLKISKMTKTNHNYFWINGYFVLLTFISVHSNKPPHSIHPSRFGYHCLHDIHIDFCKSRPRNLKLLYFYISSKDVLKRCIKQEDIYNASHHSYCLVIFNSLSCKICITQNDF